MGRAIFKQDNGKFAVFSTTTDNFILINATEEDIIKVYVDEAVEAAKEAAKREIAFVASGKPRFLTLDDALEVIENVHGKKELNKVITIMEEGSK